MIVNQLDALASVDIPDEVTLDFERMAMLALNRLSICQLSNGAVCYVVDAQTGRIHNHGYNMVRMAGVAYSLSWGAAHFRSSEQLPLSAAAERAIRFLLLSCKLQYPKWYVGEFSFEHGPSQAGKLGATALLALALTVAPFRVSYDDELRRLIASVLSVQTKTGAFRGAFENNALGNQRYFSGEALLALARYGQLTRDQEVYAAIDRAFDFYRKYFDFDPHQGFLLWHIDCWSRMVECEDISSTRREEYYNFVLTLGSVLLQQQKQKPSSPDEEGGIAFMASPGISTSLYVEALARIAGMLRRRSEDKLATTYAEAALKGLPFLRRLQVPEATEGGFHDSPHVVGGFRSNLKSKTIRMDNDQHAITCILTILEESTYGRTSS